MPGSSLKEQSELHAVVTSRTVQWQSSTGSVLQAVIAGYNLIICSV